MCGKVTSGRTRKAGSLLVSQRPRPEVAATLPQHGEERSGKQEVSGDIPSLPGRLKAHAFAGTEDLRTRLPPLLDRVYESPVPQP